MSGAPHAGVSGDTGYERAIRAFVARFGSPAPFVARAPGRVNLIGDHTDYNDGFVLPMALNRAVWIAFRPRRDLTVHMHSVDLVEDGEFSIAEFGERGHGWLEYVRGIVWALSEAGGPLVYGWDGVIASDVPVGAGLSSSAALELATARVCASVNGLVWAPATMARLAQQAENVWVGVNCGIMDQMISAAGSAGHALLIDCRSLATRSVPIPAGSAVVIMDTATRRGLVDSAYNDRRAQCEAAARVFGVRALRDVDTTTFAAGAALLDPTTRMRARHVVSENTRTLEAAAALERGDMQQVGELMDDSHASLRDDFEVSRAELDAIVTAAQAHAGCYGARMTGAGFGGCAVALIDRDAAQSFVDGVTLRYERAIGLQPSLYVCSAADGATVSTA
ncbi:MAG: galactokinase [Gemmatimonadaceae bacterium]